MADVLSMACATLWLSCFAPAAVVTAEADAASGRAASCSADTHPSRQFGGGCAPLRGDESRWVELVDVRALPKRARTFICHGNASHNGVLLVEGFLSTKELTHMQRLVDAWTDDAEDQGGWRFAYGVARHFQENFDLADARGRHRATYQAFDDRVLNRLEQRIAAFLRIPATLFENYLQLMVVERSGQLPVLHHDKNHALVRRATALVYLNGEELLGGETLFPALGGLGEERWGQQFRERTSQVLEGLQGAWPELQLLAGEPLHVEAMALCANASSAATPLAIAPLPGRAVVWWHEGSYNQRVLVPMGGEVLPEMWHVGCPVRRGRKQALQKFKNFGPEHSACSRLEWCSEGWQRMLG